MFTHKLPFADIPEDTEDKITALSIGTEWNSVDAEDIKKSLRVIYKKNQNNRCAYCEQVIDSKDDQIEHIAPKYIYASETFNPHNLVLSCARCNGLRAKGKRNTVVTKRPNYDDWSFNIIHPYLDDPCEYFNYKPDPKNSIIHIKDGLSQIQKTKADNTINWFDLNHSTLLEKRRCECVNKIVKQYNLYDLIEKISTYKKIP